MGGRLPDGWCFYASVSRMGIESPTTYHLAINLNRIHDERFLLRISVLQTGDGVSGVKLRYPMIDKVNNQDTVCLLRNDSSSHCIKHIDTKLSFIRDYQKDRTLKIVFVKYVVNDYFIKKNTSQ